MREGEQIATALLRVDDRRKEPLLDGVSKRLRKNADFATLGPMNKTS
jgi:hypothetical protein